jgi:hypothetical protein
VRFARDGKRLFLGSADRTIKEWDVDSGKCVSTMTGHTNGVWRLVLSSASDVLLSCSYDNTARLWDLKQRTCTAVLSGHSGVVRSGVFGQRSDGRGIVLTASDDHSIRIWDSANGALLSTKSEAHSGGIYGIAFVSDSDSEKEADETADHERAALSTFAEFLRNVTHHHHQQQLTIDEGKHGLLKCVRYVFRSIGPKNNSREQCTHSLGLRQLLEIVLRRRSVRRT